jgi:hypothetical protein
MNKPDELKVFISRKETTCGECKENLGHDAWIFLAGEKGALCLSCADLDHLEFLPSGNNALTIRSKKYSSLYAVVLRWSRTRKQYERQGLLVQPEAIERAEAECLEDADLREARRLRETEKREELDQVYVQRFAAAVRRDYPNCPAGRETQIAEHACRKYSGRIGRSASAKSFDEGAVKLAVVAHIRHTMTEYDDLLCQGYDRYDARNIIEGKVLDVLLSWQ